MGLFSNEETVFKEKRAENGRAGGL